MFCARRKRQQNESQDVEVEDESSSNSQKSGIVEKDSKQVPVLPETPTTSATTDSTPSEAPKRKTKRSSLWHSVDTVKEFEGGDAGVQENSPSPDLTVSSATQAEKKKKKYWCCRRFRYRHIKEKSESSADTHKESEISHPSVTTNSFRESDKISNDETTKTNSNIQSMEIDSNVDFTEIDSNLDFTKIDSNVDFTEIDSNLDFTEIDSNVDFTEIDSNVDFTEIDSNIKSREIDFTEMDSNVDSMEINSNVDFTEIDSNLDFTKIDSNLDFTEIDSNVDFTEIDSNVDFTEIDSNVDFTEIDSNVDFTEIDSNIKSREIDFTEMDSNVDSMEIDSNVDFTEIDSNFDSMKIDSNVESMEIDLNIESTEIDTNVESMEIDKNIESTENDSNIKSTEIDSNMESTEIDNVETMEVDPNTKSTEINSNIEPTENDSNVDSAEIVTIVEFTENSNEESTEIDPNTESTEIDSNIESTEIDSNIESTEIDNVESTEIDPNIKSTEINSNIKSTEIDNVESTEIYFNVESTNVQSTQAYSNIETSNPDFSFMTDSAKRHLKSQNMVYIKDILPPDGLKYRPYAQMCHMCHNRNKQAKSESVYGNLAAIRETLSTEKLVCLGLPNLAQTCYMNSTLQGLLTLTHFMQEVHNQHMVWNFHPQSELIRLFENVELCHSSTDRMEKKCVLFAFKKSIAELNSQFDDYYQKDAYEFLSCVLTKTRSLSVDLHQSAVDKGMTYTCPVNTHMAFQMLSTRTCMGCGMQSKSIKDYVSLSLDLAYRGSVSQFLQSYLKKNQLESCCRSCRAQEASQQWSFVSLPNVLIIQLQRFRSPKSNNLRKLDICVDLTRELVLNTTNTTEQTRYSLVSIISHLGSSAESGHYICDSASRQQESGDMTDRWLTYIDNITKESTAKSICQLRQKTAYVLFYEKQQ